MQLEGPVWKQPFLLEEYAPYARRHGLWLRAAEANQIAENDALVHPHSMGRLHHDINT